MSTLKYNKKWFKSKTIVGGIVAALGSVFGLVITPDHVNQSVDAVNTTVGTGFNFPNLVALAGAIVAIWGRVKATEKIATPSTTV